jgi:hypothetical protein
MHTDRGSSPSYDRAVKRWAFAGALAAALAGCSGGDGDGAGGGTGGSGGSPVDDDFCFDPDDPRVHYLHEDASQCAGVEVTCAEDQSGFDNACGCGCVDKGDPLCPPVGDPAVSWISHDPSECDAEPQCPLGDTPFSNSCGCGCIQH